jgi:hypothetical protein
VCVVTAFALRDTAPCAPPSQYPSTSSLCFYTPAATDVAAAAATEKHGLGSFSCVQSLDVEACFGFQTQKSMPELKLQLIHTAFEA